jgi:hypothetical protein
VCRDEHAAALARLHHALVLQARNRLADHGAAYAELLGQHRFGRQLAATRKGALVDLLEQLLRDCIAECAGGNLLEHAALN